MANSPAKRHYTRTLSAVEASQRKPAELMTGATAYEQHMMMLQQDRLRLKQVQSDEGKAALKRDMLPAYAPYLEGVLAANTGAKDELVTTLMVWAIDVGAFESALQIADYVLRHKLDMPDRFRRTTGCLVAEEIAEAALKSQASGGEFNADVLARATHLTAEQDMPDEVRAKLYLASGRAVLRNVNDETPPPVAVLEQCVADLKRAIELHGSCGGKKDLERAERLLKKQTAASSGSHSG